MEKLPRHAALPCRVQALGGGWLNVIVHTRDGGFAEEAVLVVHQVLVDAGSRKTRVEALTDAFTATRQTGPLTSIYYLKRP